MHKTLYKTGFIAYVILLIMATWFYKERTVFMDAAYHLFHILMSNDFTIQHNRFGAVVTQIFPVTGSKLGLSLKSILLLYSTGTMFYYFLCYFICGTILKQYGYALVVLLFSILFATETFYWPYSELQQGCTMLLVMFAVLNTNIHPAIKYGVMLALTITLAFIHPLIIFPASFLFIYLLLSGRSNISNRALLLCFALFIITYLVKTIFFKPPYEANATAGINKTMLNLIPDYFNLYSVKKFVKDCFGKFMWIPIFALATTGYYIIKRKWALLFLYTFFVFGLISLINISYHYGDVPSFYIENLYLPVSIFLAMPVVFEMADDLRRKNIAIAILVIIIITGSFRIYNQRDFFKSRVDWLRGYYSDHAGEKLIVHQSHVPMGTLIFSWGSSYEFWLLSTLEQNKTESIIISDNIDALIPPPGKTTSFITAFGGHPYDMFPTKYFKLTDTVSEYTVIPAQQMGH